ncbi:glycine cleavage system aminomethyltransferase GcvT [Actinomyces bowdenii]|uniref:Glycine cleavage system protein T n=1 Tax=Actinomyces bowdenii TaxID=131109 RepID=A0A853EJQ3_9ACTO|nr:glycine cleavage system aminomethyltransferase GcvT [Actinomyces bowdenii]MBF0695903.1 glycine cleavage system protein T [Actinomyces bowdenii]NYS68076.1 glycine cleavage system protein T [Actinomyces bowdenii]
MSDSAPMRPAPRRTPLHAVHRELEAVFTDFGGWEMPLRYGSDLAEHRAVRTSAGLFDLSHMGEVKVEGPGVGQALDRALVGRVSALAVGRARYSMMVTEEGGIIDDLIVYHVGQEEFLVVPNASNREEVAVELVARCAGLEAAVTDISPRTALLAVQGPRAEEILRGVVESGAGIPAALRPEPGGARDEDCGADVLCGPGILARLRYYAAVRATAAGHSILLARTGYTGEDGFELFCGAEDAEDLWRVITASAQGLALGPVEDGQEVPLPVLTPCGLASRDSLRLEAGMPLYGHELTRAITPYDACLGAVVALDRPDFVGRTALEERKEREGQEGTEVLVALAGQGRRAARAGCPVLDEAGRQLGTVTSGLLSPTLGHPIALARMTPHSPQEPAWPVGTELSVDVRGRLMPMSVVTTPFYKRPR